jgi:hypothetical protein
VCLETVLRVVVLNCSGGHFLCSTCFEQMDAKRRKTSAASSSLTPPQAAPLPPPAAAAPLPLPSPAGSATSTVPSKVILSVRPTRTTYLRYLQVNTENGRMWQHSRDPSVFIVVPTDNGYVLRVDGPPGMPRYIGPIHRHATHLALTSFTIEEAAVLRITQVSNGQWELSGQTPKGVRFLRANCYPNSPGKDNVGVTLGTSMRSRSRWEWFNLDTPTAAQEEASSRLLAQYWRQAQGAAPRPTAVAARDREAECARREQARAAWRAAADAKQEERRAKAHAHRNSDCVSLKVVVG